MSNLNPIRNIISNLVKPAAEQLHLTSTKSAHRTSIEELLPIGYELSEEHLRLVSGGMRSVGTCCDTASCDDD